MCQKAFDGLDASIVHIYIFTGSSSVVVANDFKMHRKEEVAVKVQVSSKLIAASHFFVIISNKPDA